MTSVSSEFHLYVVGLGLIGGSVAGGLAGEDYRLSGWDRNTSRAEKARRRGIVQSLHPPDELPASVDAVMLAVPVPEMPELVKRILSGPTHPRLVTDVGSTKQWICAQMEALLPPSVEFVGAHPMAGSEQEGLEASDPLLFENALCVVTPTRDDTEGRKRVVTLWETLGAHILRMSPAEHDRSAAHISHLPHLVAAALLHAIKNVPSFEDHALPLAAGGFRDTTRIAGGDPDLWRDIFQTNKDHILESLDQLEAALNRIRDRLRAEQWDDVTDWLQRAREIRRRIPEKAKGLVGSLYELRVQAPDRPGVLAEITGVLGEASVNITDIEVLRVREGEMGTIRLGFRRPEERERAEDLLRRKTEDIKLI